MAKLKKVGTYVTVDAWTGKITKVQPRAMTLLPAAPGKCGECATEHDPEQPHNQQSLFYQMDFHGTHGRHPTWTDAMSHCTPEMQAMWRGWLIKLLCEKGMRIPDDLLPVEEGGS